MGIDGYRRAVLMTSSHSLMTGGNARTPPLTCRGTGGGRRDAERSSALDLGPAPQQVVIDIRQLQDRFGIRVGLSQRFDGRIHIKEQATLRIVADHALNPEE